MGDSLFRGALVRLAAARPEDAEIIARWTENDEYQRLVDADPARPLPPQTFTFGEPDMKGFYFHLRTLTDDRLIGFMALHSIEWNNGRATLSMGIGDPADWNKGYGSDALRLILRYAFDELNLYRVGLDVIAYNARAIRVYEKAGFQREGAIRGAVHRDGQRYDSILMGILRDEWRASRRATT